MRHVALSLLFLGQIPPRTAVGQDDPLEGAVRLAFESKGARWSRSGLMIGRLPPPLEIGVALVDQGALYSDGPDLARVHSMLPSGQKIKGQPLELPAIEVGSALRLAAVAVVPRAIGVAACENKLRPGDPITVRGASLDFAGTIERVERPRFVAKVRSTEGMQIGDPVFVGSSGIWAVLGMVSAIQSNRIEVMGLSRIFRGLASEHRSWALQPHGFCRGSTEDAVDVLLPALRPALRAMGDGGQLDPPALRLGFRRSKELLSQPGSEHYLFDETLPEDDQLAQFWSSVAGMMGDERVRLRAPASAPVPIARLVARVDGRPDRGWALAIGHMDRYLLLATAAHLVLPEGGVEPELTVYYSTLQGFGVEARRLPLVDREMDLAIIATSAEMITPAIFGGHPLACADGSAGEIQIPVHAWGWSSKRLHGLAQIGSKRDQLVLSGVEIGGSFSGGVILRDGAEIAGLITKDLGSTRGSLGVTIHRALRMIEGVAEVGLPPPLYSRCGSTSIEERTIASALLTLKGAGPKPPTREELSAIFRPEDLAHLDLVQLPRLGAELVEFGTPSRVSAGCSLIAGQEAVVMDVDTAPLDEKGRPINEPEGCSFRRGMTPIPIFVREPQLACAAWMSFERRDVRVLFVEHAGGLRDGSFLAECSGMVLRPWIRPRWVESTAHMASSLETVTIPAGRFLSGGCTEKRTGDAYCVERVVDPKPATTSSYRITKRPITVGQYARCVDSGRCSYQLPGPVISEPISRSCNWGAPQRADHPMNCVNWSEAQQYCRSVGGRLPAGLEWEKAARGTDGRTMPWQEDRWAGWPPDLQSTSPVGLAAELASPYGVEELGLLEEWTADQYGPNPGFRLIRGLDGKTFSWGGLGLNQKRPQIGFRCVL